ncbi:MAG: DUF3795 domain-containing protein [Bacteroidales bacterium]
MESLKMNSLIAPCGMNCGICMAYLREKNKCPGCRGSDKGKPVTRLRCKIKKCDQLNSEFCFDCEEFPCKMLKHLDKRYRIKYNMSMIENNINIKGFGVLEFLKAEKIKWTCIKCGGTICVHKGKCSACGNNYQVSNYAKSVNS